MQAQLAEFDEEIPGPSCRRPSGLNEDEGPVSDSWVLRTREQLRVCPSLRLVLQDPTPVLVVAVQRYLGEGTRPAVYYYDVTISDGAGTDTWFLSPELGHLVQRNLLRCGTQTKISRCSYRFQEKTLGSGLVCIEELELEGEQPAEAHHTQLDLGEQLPLQGGRKHYLPLWNREDPYGPMWKECKQADERIAVDVSRVCSLQHLENIWRVKTNLPPVLVRIMHKSRLRYFGKPDKKVDIPYQAYIEVADYSGMMSLVLWNSLCPEWFNTLQIGRVILLQNYTVKKGYPKRTLPTSGNSQVKRLPSLEISLNARDPLPVINVIQENLVKPDWRLPEVLYLFATRVELNDLPHNKVCDVIGLVTYVGRCERKRVSDDSEDFWLYRWIKVIDGTTDQPIIMEIFATSQPDLFEQIYPMSYLVCTQMRVVREDPEDSSNFAYLTTSNESQIFITGHHKGQPYISDQKVKNFIGWMKTQNEAEVKEKVVMGGYLPYPLTPATFLKYCNENKVESILTSFSELKKTFGNLHYREHKRIAVQGIVVALRCLAHNTNSVLRKDPVSYIEDGQEGIKLPETEQSAPQLQKPAAEVCLQPKNKHKKPMNMRKRPHEPALNDTKSSSVVPHTFHDSESSASDSHISEDQEDTNETLENDASKSTKAFWESDLWSEVKNSLKEHLHYNRVFPESLPRKFNYNHKEFLMQQYNVHPSKLSTMCHSRKKIQEFTCANSLGHCELTILSINQDLAIDVIALPALCSNNSWMFTMDHVQSNDHESSANTDYGELVTFVNAQDRLRVICILDICHLGENKVEVCLNRIYNPASERGCPV
ncbi:RPA-related protein RADX [Spea bombifrons]|uniref:RPA-related protein RADX n=1 Tax=Spea bombifrons TaxID=233779 RepID=UPI00234935B3|nr:RPA-related protein RADX [Spea bombifrons]